MKNLNLEELLSLPKIPSPEEYFPLVAEKLLTEYILRIVDEDFLIKEIEFYLDQDNHKDPFIHGAVEQKNSGTWYFHKRGIGFKEGNYKGLDLTFGNTKRTGGILLRSIQSLSNPQKIICGPSLLVSYLLLKTKKSKVADLVPSLDLSAFSSSRMGPTEGPNALILLTSPKREDKIISAPRSGFTLKEKNFDERMNFIMKEYRFFSTPLPFGINYDKGKNLTALSLLKLGLNPNDYLDISQNVLDKYKTHFANGKTKNSQYFKTKLLNTKTNQETLEEFYGFLSQNSSC